MQVHGKLCIIFECSCDRKSEFDSKEKCLLDGKDILSSCFNSSSSMSDIVSVPIKTNYLEIPTFSRDSVSNRLNFYQRRNQRIGGGLKRRWRQLMSFKITTRKLYFGEISLNFCDKMFYTPFPCLFSVRLNPQSSFSSVPADASLLI